METQMETAEWSVDNAEERYARAVLQQVYEPDEERPWVDDLGPVATWEALASAARGTSDLALFGSTVTLARKVAQARSVFERRLDPRVAAARSGARFVIPGDEEWPSELDRLDVPPLGLWVKGPLRLNDLPWTVGIVGARASTAYGEHVAQEIAQYVGTNQRAVVSGLAYGIDAAAHRAALTVDAPTVAVLAGGVDVAYPRANADLFGRIVERFVVVSEAWPGAAPSRPRFLARNRLIAALSTVVVLVEAADRSGARTTCRRAREIGTPVAAVPGPVTSLTSLGCHMEIREHGARLVTCGRDVDEMVDEVEGL